MGPVEKYKSSTLPLGALLTWDLKIPPWKDGKGDQEQYATSSFGLVYVSGYIGRH